MVTMLTMSQPVWRTFITSLLNAP